MSRTKGNPGMPQMLGDVSGGSSSAGGRGLVGGGVWGGSQVVNHCSGRDVKAEFIIKDK